MDKKLFQIFLTIFLLASCSRQNIEPSVEPTPSTESQLFASDIEDRIHQVENGLVMLDSSDQPQWGETTSLVERIEHYQVPGIGIAVIEDFELEWSSGYGFLEAGGRDAVAPDSLFHAGSIAKTLSAAAALTLVEQGLLDLDENVNDKLVSWQVPENQYTTDEKVTLRRLLSHSAGLQDGFTNRSSSDPMPDYIAPAGESPRVTLTQLLDAEPGVDVDGATAVTMVPGTEYRYANADYAILELLAVDVIEEPFADFMAETVLEPLQMRSSTYQQPLPEDLRARAAIEHDTGGKPLVGDRWHFPMLAAGGLWTTPSDLARFAIEMMHGFNGESEKILSYEMANEMLSSQMIIENNPLFDSSGLGFHLSGEGAETIIGHTGATWGSTAIMLVYPETGQGAVIMTNSATGSQLLFEVLLSIAAEYGWPMENDG